MATSFIPLNQQEELDRVIPLSPYIFILAMEYLTTMISNTVLEGNWKPFKFKNNDLQISHLLFANDVLLFFKADNKSISSIKHIINSFCQVSGVNINNERSKLWFSPFIPKNRKSYLSNKLQINITTNLGTYLGYPLKLNYSSLVFNFIIHKLRQKLKGWKMNHLSFVGRSQLVQSTLTQTPNYQMRVFHLPQKIHSNR